MATGTDRIRAHPRIAAGIAGIVLAAACAVMSLLPGPREPAAVDPRTRTFANYAACLLTDPAGTDAQPARAVWAGMQHASLTTGERSTSQAAVGERTLRNAESYINTLALRGCAVIVAVGDLPTRAATTRAAAYPAVEFILVTGTPPRQRPENTTVLTQRAPAPLTQAVAAALADDYSRHGPSVH